MNIIRSIWFLRSHLHYYTFFLADAPSKTEQAKNGGTEKKLKPTNKVYKNPKAVIKHYCMFMPFFLETRN